MGQSLICYVSFSDPNTAKLALLGLYKRLIIILELGIYGIKLDLALASKFQSVLPL